jgi:hypothetical protein
MKSNPKTLLAVVVLSLCAASATDTFAGGRRPYGGSVDIPVRDFLGLVDPHVVESRSSRLVADLVHARLFRFSDNRLSGELSSGLGQVSGDTLTVTLVEGARFHDGSPVEASDVAASLRRLGALGEVSPIGRLVAALQVTAQGPRTVVIAMPRQSSVEEVRLLLARPEAAILESGQPGRGAGAFKPQPGDGERRVLVAWDGYALGRPWLQEVRLSRVTAEREESAFRFGDIELSYEAPQGPTSATTIRGGFTSWLVVFHPRYRSTPAFRGWVRQAILDARLTRYVDGRGMPADLPWPDLLAPIGAPTRSAVSATGRPELVVAFAKGEPDSEELSRALRDAISPMALGNARVVAVPGMTASAARAASDPAWDMALVRWDWAALSKAQAVHELARVLGIDPPRPADVLGRRINEWSADLVRRHEAIAAAHAERPVHLVSRIVGVAPSGPLPNLGSGFRVRGGGAP